MLLPDVNVLIYAHRREAPEHDRYARWLEDLAEGAEPFAISELGASGFVRIVTNPRIWEHPTTTPDAFEFVRRLRDRSNARLLTHGARSWEIFERLCVAAKARGKLVADAYHAALAMEHGCEFVTADSDFARFAGLRHRHPLQEA
ncbi:MAG: type II toxin-antitoxin system VapC family toxin [Myxococcales bacterium]|nr:type II toxin-antitoxin system VapC family toxin [Myxococcales bacterium]MCB9578985.1 type II toxin-antitoxin system VapC family toxin [Polyangiaceae bacterium]